MKQMVLKPHLNLQGKLDNAETIDNSSLLAQRVSPDGIGWPLKNHSTFMVGSLTGVSVASMWTAWPSIRRSWFLSERPKLGFSITATSSGRLLGAFCSRRVIWAMASGCWVSTMKSLLAGGRRGRDLLYTLQYSFFLMHLTFNICFPLVRKQLKDIRKKVEKTQTATSKKIGVKRGLKRGHFQVEGSPDSLVGNIH